jgi:hypothetical protein
MACFSIWDIGACGCTPPFSHTFTVCGCVTPAVTPGNFQGLTVSVYSSNGGSLLASGTTDSSGAVTLTWADSGTPLRYVTSTSPWPGRNNAYAGNLYLSNNGSHTLSLAAATGYVCCSLDFAVPTTLYWSGGDISGQALTYSYGSWGSGNVQSTNTATGASAITPTGYGCPCCNCVSTTLTIQVNLGAGCSSRGTGGVQRVWSEVYCPAHPPYYQYKSGDCTAGLTQPGASSGGLQPMLVPPFAYSGTLRNIGEGALADPFSGAVTVTE